MPREIVKNKESDLFFIVLGLLGFIFAFYSAMLCFSLGEFGLAFLCEILMVVLFYCTCSNIEEYKKS